MDRFGKLQWKAIACFSGIVLLFVLAVVGLIRGIGEVLKPEPVIENMLNVWITEVTPENLKLYDGSIKVYQWADNLAGLEQRGWREQVADVTLTDGKVSAVTAKDQQKISGKVLRVYPGLGVQLEKYGILQFGPDMKMYRLYDSLQLASEEEIRIGYSFCDFVVENGKICSVLVTRNEAMEYIRVQIKNSGYASNMHDKVALTADTDFVVRYGSGEDVREEFHTAGEVVEIEQDSPYFTADRIYAVPTALTGKVTLLSVERSLGNPAYRGSIEIIQDNESNGLYVINEVLLEEYLYAVVPSEMPSGYPMEALKAQAICARTYAYRRMLSPSSALAGAHVDDSTSYQVYNNISEQETTTAAVKETRGQLLYAGGKLADTYYYSTSCGYGTESDIWKGSQEGKLPYLPATRIGTTQDPRFTARSMQKESVFASFIGQVFEEDYESGEPWYRWTYAVADLDEKRMLSALQSRYKANNSLVLTKNKEGEFVSKEIKKLGKVRDISISLRNEGGVADEMLIEASGGTYKVITEHNIRYILCDGVTKVRRQDGSKIDMPNLLPSAFFTITTGKEAGNVVGYIIVGGGYGHGVGMSQNGARSMAQAGLTAQNILCFFYQDGYVEQIY